LHSFIIKPVLDTALLNKVLNIESSNRHLKKLPPVQAIIVSKGESLTKIQPLK
jgi:hypothetical protein